MGPNFTFQQIISVGFIISNHTVFLSFCLGSTEKKVEVPGSRLRGERTLRLAKCMHQAFVAFVFRPFNLQLLCVALKLIGVACLDTTAIYEALCGLA